MQKRDPFGIGLKNPVFWVVTVSKPDVQTKGPNYRGNS